MTTHPARIIVDVDVGTDDYLALLILFSYQTLGLVIIEAIICSAGNTSRFYSCTNVVRLLENVGKTNIPVYAGALEGLIPPPLDKELDHYYGIDGLADQEYSTSPNMSIIRSEPGVEALGKLVLANPGQITLLCLAPLTTEGLALKIYDNFGESIKDLWIMGGDYSGQGNVVVAPAIEYNFYGDPEAAHIVLTSYRKPITMVTWETTLNSPIPMTWLREVFVPATSGDPAKDIFNNAMIKTADTHNVTDFAPADAYLVGAFLNNALVEYSTNYVGTSVELCGMQTRGLLVLNYTESAVKNLTIIDQINVTEFKGMLLGSLKSRYGDQEHEL